MAAPPAAAPAAACPTAALPAPAAGAQAGSHARAVDGTVACAEAPAGVLPASSSAGTVVDASDVAAALAEAPAEVVTAALVASPVAAHPAEAADASLEPMATVAALDVGHVSATAAVDPAQACPADAAVPVNPACQVDGVAEDSCGTQAVRSFEMATLVEPSAGLASCALQGDESKPPDGPPTAVAAHPAAGPASGAVGKSDGDLLEVSLTAAVALPAADNAAGEGSDGKPPHTELLAANAPATARRAASAGRPTARTDPSPGAARRRAASAKPAAMAYVAAAGIPVNGVASTTCPTALELGATPQPASDPMCLGPPARPSAARPGSPEREPTTCCLWRTGSCRRGGWARMKKDEREPPSRSASVSSASSDDTPVSLSAVQLEPSGKGTPLSKLCRSGPARSWSFASSSVSTCPSPSRAASNADTGARAQFRSAEEYADFIKDPNRVMYVEWRRVRRSVSAGLTSHSMLDCQLQDGSRWRFEKWSDTGMLESTLMSSVASDGAVYRGRKAADGELLRPLRLVDLRQMAQALGAQPYSLTGANCHHFVRDLWNALVIRSLRRYTHPDRIKGGMLVGITMPFERLGVKGRFLQSRSMRSFGCTEAEQAGAALLA